MAAILQRPLTLFKPARGQKQSAAGMDYVLILTVGALITIGLLLIYSVSFGPNVQGGKVDPLSTVEKQLVWLVLGCAILLALTRLDYHIWQRAAVPIMALTVASLALLLVVGTEEQGAKRWLFSGSIQPGEFAKIATVIYIAAWVTSKGTRLKQVIYGLVPFGIIVGLVAGLIVLEPNYSTALLIAFTALAMFFVAGADIIQFTLSLLIGGLTAAALVSRSPRAMERIMLVIVDPFKLPTDEMWQLAQTLLALASGGLWGKGLGTGGGQYGYVPLAHSDGIFAIWGEETGLVGTWLLLGLLLFFAYRGFRIATKAPDDFGRVLAAGVTFWLTFQAFINIGVVTQLVPFTGQPLPFISAGGSSLLTAMAGVGLLLSISRGKAPPLVVKSTPRAPTPDESEMKEKNASIDYWRRDRRSRVPAVGSAAKPQGKRTRRRRAR